jgi:hypothetical protein
MASSNGKRALMVVAVVLLLVAAGGVTAVVYYANRGRATQLQTDEMGRQRDAINAARPKAGPTTAPPALGT